MLRLMVQISVFLQSQEPSEHSQWNVNYHYVSIINPKNAKVNRERLQEVFMSELDLAAMNFCLAGSNNVAKGTRKVVHRLVLL